MAVVDPILDDAVPIHSYARGSWGPKEAETLLPNREHWHDPTGCTTPAEDVMDQTAPASLRTTS